MKKYLLALIPLVVGLGLSLIFSLMEPADYLTNPYRTEYWLAILKTSWFVIGVVLSPTIIIVIFINDMFDITGKYLDMKSMKRHERKLQQKYQPPKQAL